MVVEIKKSMHSKDIFLQTKFCKSSISVKDLLPDIGTEVAFCGRSNSGKSTVLNSLTGNKKMAKTSKTPGRTKAINFFSIDTSLNKRIVDLPGYGFAKVSKNKRREWGKVIDQYLNYRKSLKGLVIVMDIRHPFKDSDISLIEWSKKNNIPLKILLNKADKVSKNKIKNEISMSNKTLKKLSVVGEAQAFSAKSMIGIEQLKEELTDWFEN